MWVLMRTSDGAFVARKGSAASYVRALQFAETFSTKEIAERASCPENEVPVDVDRIMRGERL